MTERILGHRQVGRRAFLGAAALGAAGLGLAACAGEDNGASAEETPTIAVPRGSGPVSQARDAVLPPVPADRATDSVLDGTGMHCE